MVKKKEAEPHGPTSLKWLPKADLNDPLRFDLNRSGGSLFLQCGAGFFDQTTKGSFFPDSQIGKDLAVEGNFRSGHALHKSTISDSVGPAGSVDPHDPQGSPGSLLVPPIAVGMLACVVDRIFGIAVQLRLIAEVTPGALDNALPPTARSWRICGSGHVFLLCIFEPGRSPCLFT
jgi:hypothetical protein